MCRKKLSSRKHKLLIDEIDLLPTPEQTTKHMISVDHTVTSLFENGKVNRPRLGDKFNNKIKNFLTQYHT
jgi:hypothetical protein